MREQFPIFRRHPKLVYLDSAATTHKPDCVIAALTRFYAEENATVHRAVYQASLLATERYDAARETVRAFLNAEKSEEIVFTRGTTEALNLVAQSYGARIRAGDEVLISEMEHHSNIVPWQMLCARTGATLRVIPMDAQGVLQWTGTINDHTRIVAIAHMSNVTGTINPIRDIAQEAHRHGAILCVDGAQAAPHLPIDVQALGCDFYAFSGHKCYGPTGIGALYGRYALLESMPPIIGGSDMIETVSLTHFTHRPPPLRFEAGTPIIAPAIALAEALRFLRPGEDLTPYTLSRLQEIPRLRLLGTAPHRGPIFTFHIDGIHPFDLGTLLDLRHIAIRTGHLCAQPLLAAFGLQTAARISLGLYNTRADIDHAIDAIKSLLIEG